MKRLLLVLVLVAACPALLGQGRPRIDVTHYDLTVEVDPPNHALRGLATVRLQLSETVPLIPFEINNRLNVSDVNDEAGKPLVIRFDESNSNRLLVGADAPFAAGDHALEIRYDGTLERESYAFLDRSRVSDGYIDEGAAYLSYSYRWFPVHDPLFDPATARITVTVPLGFTAVAAGTPGPVQTLGVTESFEWELAQPVNQFALVIGKLREYRFASEKPPLHIFLGAGSDSRAEKLSQQISSALTFFQQNLAPYPFEHLTVVGIPNDVRDEMASPGIVYLPLDLLNDARIDDVELARRLALQWWGLGVIPETPQDMILGDGFAYYQAAQYLQSRSEQAYKDEILKLAVLALKYESRASISGALRLGFRSDEYSSVVGGKGAWVLHMLEDIMGRDKVLAALKELASGSLGKQASLAQFKSKVSAAAGQDLQWFFGQWVDATGVPELEVDYTVYKLAEGGFRVDGTIKQNLEMFRMPLRVAVETPGKVETETVQVAGKATKFELKSAERPVRLLLDPEQKVLRNSVEMELAVHIALGYELFEKNQFLEAIREYERAVRLNPRSSLAHYRLGEVFFEQANTQSASNAFRDALNGDLQPQWVEPMSRLHLGKIFDILGERQRALAEYQKVINAKDNTFGAVSEAEKYSREPFTKKSTVMDTPER